MMGGWVGGWWHAAVGLGWGVPEGEGGCSMGTQGLRSSSSGSSPWRSLREGHHKTSILSALHPVPNSYLQSEALARRSSKHLPSRFPLLPPSSPPTHPYPSFHSPDLAFLQLAFEGCGLVCGAFRETRANVSLRVPNRCVTRDSPSPNHLIHSPGVKSSAVSKSEMAAEKFFPSTRAYTTRKRNFEIEQEGFTRVRHGMISCNV